TDLVSDEAPHPSPRALARATLGDLPASADTLASLPRLADMSWESRPPILDGLWWLLRLQNRDRGWPTFCRGCGTLPFDRSVTDLTAHVLRAFVAWKKQIEADQVYAQALQQAHQTSLFTGFPLPDVGDEMARALEFLEEQQRPDGSWLPLWFGNQYAPGDVNP